MKRLVAALAISIGLASAALAQVVTNPVAVGSAGAYNSGPITCTSGQFCFLQVDANGNLKTTGGGGGGGLSVVDQATFTYGTSPFTPTGGFYNSVITPLLSGQQGAVALTANRSMHTVDDNSAAMLAALQAGVGNNGATAPTTSVQVGSPDGSGNLQPASAANPFPVINAGCASYHLANGTANTTNATNMKAVPATLCNLVLESVPGTGIVGYLKIYDTAGTPTCSSATGLKHVFAIPASASSIGGIRPISPPGETYATGIGFCVVGGPTDTDNTAAPAGILVEASTK